MWLGLHWIDWLVLSAYLVGVTLLGVMAYKKVKDTADFFMGGRRFGKIFMMFFAFGSGTSSEQATAVVAGTWRAGLAGIWWQFLWLWATPFYWLVAPLLRRMRALTTSDFFEARYHSSTSALYAIYGMIMAITFIAGSLFAAGKMVNALTGGELEAVAEDLDLRVVPKVNAPEWEERGVQNAELHAFVWYPLEGYQIAILAITVLFVAYGIAGGLGAAVWTDFVQGILTITFSFLLLPWIFNMIGGLSALHENAGLKDGMLDLFGRPEVARILDKEPITLFYVVMLALTALAGIVVQPHIMGVCGAGKTEFEGRFGFTVGNFIKRICTVAWTFTALACIVWYLSDTGPLANPPPDDPARDAKIAEYEKLKARTSADYQSLSDEEKARLDKFDKNFADELFGRAAYDILPGVAPGLVGLLLASLLAAMMSTCDAQMIVGSGLFTENIYRRYFRPGKSQGHYVGVGRFAALGIVLVALILGTTFTDVIDALKVIIKTPAAIGISMWIGIVWRRWTSVAVWVSSIVAYAAWALIAYLPTIIGDSFQDLTWMHFMTNGSADVPPTKVLDSWTMLIYLSAGLFSGLIVSYVTPRVPQEKLDRFYRVMRTPVKEGEKVETPCTLPEDAAEPVPKWFNHPDIELPKPTKLDVFGFFVSWALVGLIVLCVTWLAGG
jgi:Na+/proline symporter